MKSRKVSKKTKKVWRKHIDIEDVNQFLEDKRLEERLGKPFDERHDSDLYTIDASPKVENVFTCRKKHPISKRNHVRTLEERKHPKLKRKEAIRKSKGIFKHKEIVAITTRNLAIQKKKEEQIKNKEINEDIWTTSGTSNQVLNDQWLQKSTVHHIHANTGKLHKVKQYPSKNKTSSLPPIEIPHPGLSYNPSLKDHVELLSLVAEKEKKIIKEEKHLTRVTTKMFTKKSPQVQHALWLTEMSEGISSIKNDSLNESDNDGNEIYKSINPPVKNRKKNLKQRRKQMEQRKLDSLKKKQKEEKKKVADVYKLKFIQENLMKKEKHLEKLREKRIKTKSLLQSKPKRLNKKKFEENDIEFNMGKDISGNLRNLKTEGNLLLDRFNSLQKRNILVPTDIHVVKKAKTKRFKKPSHRIEGESNL